MPRSATDLSARSTARTAPAQPACRSAIAAAARTVATGLTASLPSRSSAEPCTVWYSVRPATSARRWMFSVQRLSCRSEPNRSNRTTCMMSAHSLPAMITVRSGGSRSIRLRFTVSGWHNLMGVPWRSEISATHSSSAPSSRWNL